MRPPSPRCWCPNADHLPLYQQAQIYARQGIDLDRSTLADWVGRAAWHLRPLHERLLVRLKGSTRLFADTAPVLDPGRGRTKTGQLWAYAADDRSWGGTDPPGVAYLYASDRKADRPIAHLDGFIGILQVDGYANYRKLAERNDVQLCWSHVRRKFYELATPGPSPIASEALQHIAGLYAIEKEIRRRPTTREPSTEKPAAAFETWLRARRVTGGKKRMEAYPVWDIHPLNRSSLFRQLAPCRRPIGRIMVAASLKQGRGAAAVFNSTRHSKRCKIGVFGGSPMRHD